MRGCSSSSPTTMPSRTVVFHFFAIRAQWLVWLSALGAAMAPLSRVLPTHPVPWLQWLVELAAHWQWAYATVGAATALLWVLLALMLRRRSAWLVLPALVMAGSLLWQPATLPAASATIAANARVLAVGTANLNLATTDFTPLRRATPTAWPCRSPTRLGWRFCRATRWRMRRCCSPARTSTPCACGPRWRGTASPCT